MMCMRDVEGRVLAPREASLKRLRRACALIHIFNIRVVFTLKQQCVHLGVIPECELVS